MARTDSGFVELVFETDDLGYPAAAISRRFACHVELLDSIRIPFGDGTTVIQYIRVYDGPPETNDKRAAAIEASENATLLKRTDGELLVEYRAGENGPGNSIVETLVNEGTIPVSATAFEGTARITALLPPSSDPGAVIETVRTVHPSVRLISKCRREPVASLFTQRGFQTSVRDRFTERQWEALRLAYEGGYFERPRERSQAELAEQMGVSQKTFSQHLNAAERKLLDALFASK